MSSGERLMNTLLERDQVRQHEPENRPRWTPAEPDHERRRKEGHTDFRETDSHAREGEGATAPAQKPLRDDNVHHHGTHHRVAQSHEGQANECKLRESLNVAEQEIAHRNDHGADGDQPAAAVTIDERSHERSDTRADDCLAGAEQGKNAA